MTTAAPSGGEDLIFESMHSDMLFLGRGYVTPQCVLLEFLVFPSAGFFFWRIVKKILTNFRNHSVEISLEPPLNSAFDARAQAVFTSEIELTSQIPAPRRNHLAEIALCLAVCCSGDSAGVRGPRRFCVLTCFRRATAGKFISRKKTRMARASNAEFRGVSFEISTL